MATISSGATQKPPRLLTYVCTEGANRASARTGAQQLLGARGWEDGDLQVMLIPRSLFKQAALSLLKLKMQCQPHKWSVGYAPQAPKSLISLSSTTSTLNVAWVKVPFHTPLQQLVLPSGSLPEHPLTALGADGAARSCTAHQAHGKDRKGHFKQCLKQKGTGAFLCGIAKWLSHIYP